MSLSPKTKSFSGKCLIKAEKLWDEFLCNQYLNYWWRLSPPAKRCYELIKRGADLILAAFFLLVGSWLMLLIACAIKLTSPGPIIFKQTRESKNGNSFTIYKFRSMYSQYSGFAKSPCSKNDPRLTPIGGFLRYYSLDELPQLFNVIKGEMSLIGPRAITAEERRLRIELLNTLAPENRLRNAELFEKRLAVKPGLTGLAQVSGRSSLSLPVALALELYYIEHRNFWLDLRILIKTILVVLTKKGVN